MTTTAFAGIGTAYAPALVGILTTEELTITRAAIEAADLSGLADIFATEELIAS